MKIYTQKIIYCDDCPNFRPLKKGVCYCIVLDRDIGKWDDTGHIVPIPADCPLEDMEGRNMESGVRERPILFSGAMVQAILAGNKCQTRRVVKPHIPNRVIKNIEFGRPPGFKEAAWIVNYEGDITNYLGYIKCPYGQPGDRLFVKETWKVSSFNDRTHALAIKFKAGGSTEAWFDDAKRYEQFKKFYFKNGWQSPYFMPKEATHIWLNNEGVRVERVQEINTEDAKAEGITEYISQFKLQFTEAESDIWRNRTSIENFRILWDTINAKRGYGWEVNPWVWVVEFKVIPQEVEG